LGDNIDGEAIGTKFGSSISLSSNAETVAIGASYTDGNGNLRSGQVRVYEWTSNSKWIQLGDDIDGEAENDRSGESVSLSGNGETVAVGASHNDGGNGDNSGHVRVHRLNKSRSLWIILGDDIDGEAQDDYSGRSVSLSDNGDTVAIGAMWNDGNGTRSGHVRVYRFNEYLKWIKLDDIDIDGEAVDDRFGASVSLSSDGETVAIGAKRNDGKGSSSGHVRVYRLNDDSKWIPLGDDIDGEAVKDESGSSVSLSSDGETIAIGAKYNDGNGTRSGHVRVYTLNEYLKWIPLGDDIDGEAECDQSGSSVSLSDNGRIVAIAARYNDGKGINSGHVRVYELNESLQEWSILGDDIDGEGVGDQFGSYVSLSGNGRTVAISSTPEDYYGDPLSSGYVKVYKW